jgi:hypothetical protein
MNERGSLLQHRVPAAAIRYNRQGIVKAAPAPRPEPGKQVAPQAYPVVGARVGHLFTLRRLVRLLVAQQSP